jgi:hypothetical protein
MFVLLFDQKDYEKFDGNAEVVATSILKQVNDVFCGRQPRGSPPPLQNRELTSVGGEIA